MRVQIVQEGGGVNPGGMSAPIYGREALRRLRERQAREPVGQASLLEDISPDARMEDATLTADTFAAMCSGIFCDEWKMGVVPDPTRA